MKTLVEAIIAYVSREMIKASILFECFLEDLEMICAFSISQPYANVFVKIMLDLFSINSILTESQHLNRKFRFSSTPTILVNIVYLARKRRGFLKISECHIDYIQNTFDFTPNQL